MTAAVSQELWDEFHTVVNMTSRELEEWLRTEAAGERTEATPEEMRSKGRRVVEILGKRATDLTGDDVQLMREVVETVRSQRGPELETKAGDAAWRHHLMDIGHDPLKPVRSA